ncbi:MAG: bifunctional GNAT family N-acetyltransferase/carbon-nitrogen hydrolase family protein [Cyclobacteriaceae bacterium]|nr:bifunctional GNAT family N-acetyltransferase/carbon-nitrogen hydrolase family protein [Cyclobacteriaceae bacterium]
MNVQLRNLQTEDYRDLKESSMKAYSDVHQPEWKEEEIERLLKLFPEGQFCVEVNGKAVAFALALIIDYKKFGDTHTYKQITGNYTFSTHNPKGDVLYGIDIFIHPEYRNMRLGRRLYDARKELCEHLNLRAIVAGGRLPGYREYADSMTPKEYIFKVQHKELFDAVLSFQMANDFHVKKVLKNYLRGDSSSMEYACLIEWNNIYFQEEAKFLELEKEVVRLGLVQWQMRSISTLEGLYDTIDYFIDAVSRYHSDFLLFPEFFNASLMAAYNHLPEPEAIRKLAEFTDQIRDKFTEFAVSYNVNIITGSMPYVRNAKLYNVGYLCRRDGSWERFEKLHISPSEVSAWGMVGGDVLRTFDTDSGKIGILICYDVEFPEVTRILADQGMQILFIPFQTDTQNGYTRVRHCAQARAIENECYVAISGCVGNLPKVSNMDIQYAQSAVFTPSDFAFPYNGIKAEATPNTEMTLIVDVNLNLLQELHNQGSVCNLKDRRHDLYKVVLKNQQKKNVSKPEGKLMP